MTESAVTVLIIDDDPLVRQQVRLVLGSSPDIEIVGDAADGAAGLREAQRLDPDIVLMDVSMPTMTGVEATSALRAAGGRSRVVALTAMDHEAVLEQMLLAGAIGFVPKEYASDELIYAIRSVARGGAFVSPHCQPMLLTRLNHLHGGDGRVEARRRLVALTERELAVARHVATGARTASIAQALFVSESTVKSQLDSIRTKLDVSSREEIAVLVERADEALPA